MATTLRNRFALLSRSLPTVPIERPANSSSEVVEGLTIAQATELLDWLEGHNIRASDVRLDDTGRMIVAWNS